VPYSRIRRDFTTWVPSAAGWESFIVELPNIGSLVEAG
jgi:hypothetical protein